MFTAVVDAFRLLTAKSFEMLEESPVLHEWDPDAGTAGNKPLGSKGASSFFRFLFSLRSQPRLWLLRSATVLAGLIRCRGAINWVIMIMAHMHTGT